MGLAFKQPRANRDAHEPGCLCPLAPPSARTHADFLRDVRGDTLHPSTLDLFGELGLAEALLARPHDRVPSVTASVAGRSYTVADFGHLHANHRFIALMPQ